MIRRSLDTLRQIRYDLRGAGHITADLGSRTRYSIDLLLHRALYFVNLPGGNRLREITLVDGTRLTYRRNRGDIFTIREIWIDEVYSLPEDGNIDVVLDLGAHIGSASCWFARQYSPSLIIAVEPSPSNVALARRNFARNGVPARLVEGAVGETDTLARFAEAPASNLGRLDPAGGTDVRVFSIGTVLEVIPRDKPVDVVKVDVEGAEAEVFSGDLAWLARVRLIIGEFHDEKFANTLAEMLARQGFSRLLPEAQDRRIQCFGRSTS
jgi:FkbM family methyltransferase